MFTKKTKLTIQEFSDYLKNTKYEAFKAICNPEDLTSSEFTQVIINKTKKVGIYAQCSEFKLTNDDDTYSNFGKLIFKKR